MVSPAEVTKKCTAENSPFGGNVSAVSLVGYSVGYGLCVGGILGFTILWILCGGTILGGESGWTDAGGYLQVDNERSFIHLERGASSCNL